MPQVQTIGLEPSVHHLNRFVSCLHVQLCYSIVDAECQKAFGATNCVKKAMDKDYWDNYAPPPVPVTDTLAFKLGLGLGAAALVAAALGTFLLCKARKKRAKHAEKMDLPVYHVPSKRDNGKGGDDGGKDVAIGNDGPTRKTSKSSLASTNSYGLAAGTCAGARSMSDGSSLATGGMHMIEDSALLNALPGILSSSVSREQAATIQLGKHSTSVLKVRGGLGVTSM